MLNPGIYLKLTITGLKDLYYLVDFFKIIFDHECKSHNEIKDITPCSILKL
jgi:hypothetical protein